MKVKIEKLDHYGRGIAKINNKICFIENALKDEIVEIKITKEKKNYLEGKVVQYIKTSSDRIKETCPYSNICGGCHLNHISIKDENEFKENKVKDLVEHFVKIDSSIVKKTICTKENNYRNKIVLHVENKKLGLYEASSNNLVEIDSCYLGVDEINNLIPYLKQLVENNELKEITVKVGNETNEIMVIIKGKVTNYFDILNRVDVLIISDKVVTSKNKITSKIGKYKFLISENAFFQVNKSLTKKLYDEVLKNVKDSNSHNVLDLYCGTGTIGIYISEYVNKVLGIEINKMAVTDAIENKDLNNINNINFMGGKVEDLITTIKDKYDTIIVDPPRGGLDKKTINNIIKISPNTIIYVSCDPATLCRDLNILKEVYNIKYIQPFNMFPRTYHVECVCILKLR